MADLVKSMTDALSKLESAVDPQKIDQEKKEEMQKSLEIDLVKSEEDQSVKETYLEVDPFFEHIASLNAKNNGRVAVAVNGVLDVVKAQNTVILDLVTKIDAMSKTLEAVATHSSAPKSALSASEAENLQKAIYGGDVKPADPSGKLEESQMDTKGMTRADVSRELVKAWKGGDQTLGQDVITFESIPSGYALGPSISMLSLRAQDLIRGVIEKK